MNTNTRYSTETSRSRATDSSTLAFRSPNFDCREQGDSVKLIVYVPGVDATGVEITTRGPDLMVTARKRHFVRVNFGSLNLESAQRDYRLMLRLGRHLDFENLNAGLSEGVLTITIPKRDTKSENVVEFGRLRRVA